jgi:anti-sigma factor RsiW
MLNCKEVSERASALIDGELGMFDQLQMRLHLAMCKGCDAFVRQMRTTRDLTNSALDAVPADRDGDDQRITDILSQLGDEKKSGS